MHSVKSNQLTLSSIPVTADIQSRPTGVISILRSQAPGPDRRFTAMMAMAGHNTGNLLFTHAVWEQVKGPKVRIGFQFSPTEANAKLKAVVIPAANWLGPHLDLSELADLVEQLDIPVTLIGLGAQDVTYSSEVNIPEGTMRLIKAVAERSRSISVRGDYSREIVQATGIRNVVTTGCPSLYQDLQPNAAQTLARASYDKAAPTLFHSTRYSARETSFVKKKSAHLKIFRHAYRYQLDLLMQSEPEEISMITESRNKPEITQETIDSLLKIYGASTWAELEPYILEHTKVFFDIPSWSQAVTQYGSVYGTRLHATIMALNSGVPAILLPHDSRTQEVCDFASLPSIPAHKARIGKFWIKSAFSRLELSTYLQKRTENQKIYTDFLAENDLEPAESLYAIS